ncbi:alpha-galactosidase, partial [Klebsiella oxytoca]
MEYIKVQENGINIVFGITDKNQLKLLHFSKNEFCEGDLCKVGPECKAEDRARKEQFLDEAFQLVQVSLSGYDRP